MADSMKEPTSPGKPPSTGRRPVSRPPLRLGRRVAQQRNTRGWIIAAVIHVALAAIVLPLLTFGHGLDNFLNFGEKSPVEERVTYVEPRKPEPEPAPVVVQRPPVVRDRAAQPRESTGPVVAPGVPAAPVVTTPPRDTGGSVGTATSTAPVIDGVRPELRGVQPGYTDPRLWGAAPPGTRPMRTGADRLDSIISYAITTAADSIDAIARANGEGGRRPGDWTTRDKNGDKWGWDEGGIRLGKVTIPNALLGLLPLNAQQAMSGNPTAIDRERRLSLARRDIMMNQQRSIGEAEFKKLVKELRERKDREYQERMKDKDKPKVIGSGN
jgi:hypothetical protein